MDGKEKAEIWCNINQVFDYVFDNSEFYFSIEATFQGGDFHHQMRLTFQNQY